MCSQPPGVAGGPGDRVVENGTASTVGKATVARQAPIASPPQDGQDGELNQPVTAHPLDLVASAVGAPVPVTRDLRDGMAGSTPSEGASYRQAAEEHRAASRQSHAQGEESDHERRTPRIVSLAVGWSPEEWGSWHVSLGRRSSV